ncbi:sensor histidine kinase [Flavihumibacter fluvii]|uniref:sensor histidine kinase n=1 Tax=Flavihumibacter fluvii TaxID=2838157 RepID=UPI001BDF6AC6|nr:histidine kinase [Flavihumibacter fluvii]ULQ51391.1 histidine kinase [Flavihumibacter fluvii]
MFNHRFRYLFIVALGTYSYLNAVFAEVFELYSIHAPWYLCMSTMVLLTLVVWEGNRFAAPIVEKQLAGKDTWVKLVVSFGIGTVFSMISAILLTAAIGVFLAGISSSSLKLPFKLAVLYATRINLFLHTINAIFVFVFAYKQKEIEAESLQKISVQAQLQAVRNQINPHFLFNNLNVLSSLVIKDNPDANEFVEAFAKVYRHILNTQHDDLVTLRTELDFIKPYIFLLQKRFPASLSVSLNIRENLLEGQVVPGALQMLIENAIKHNIVSRKNPLVIDISVNGNAGLVVTNNLQKKDMVEPSTQIGLNNIRQRYELTTGKTISIQQDADYFSVSLPLIT